VEKSSRHRHTARIGLIWVGLAVSAFFAYVSVRNVRWSEVWDGLTSSNYWWVIPMLLLLFVAQGVRGLRWQYLFPAETRPPYWPTLEATLLGQFFNTILPARAGEVARIVALHRTTRTSRAEITSTVVIERVFDVLALLTLLFVFVPWFPHVSWLHAAALLAIVFFTATIVSIAVLFRWGEKPFLIMLRPLTRLGLPFLTIEHAEHAAASFVRGAAALRHPGLGAFAFGLSIVSWLLLGLSTWMLMIGFHLGLSPLAGLLVMIAVGLSLILPASPGSVGVFEAAALVGLKAYGIEKADALSFAIVLHAVSVLPFLVFGGLVLWRQRRVKPGGSDSAIGAAPFGPGPS
jgi:uncharacterized membrane protein YbhN (UPF0104 family)